MPDYNKLLKDYQNLVGMNENTKQDIENKNKELELIKKETIQLDNVSFKKLCSVLVNLPTVQLIGAIGFFLGITVVAFTLGTMVEKTNSNNELFEVRTENTKIKKNQENVIDSLNKIYKVKVDSILKSKSTAANSRLVQ